MAPRRHLLFVLVGPVAERIDRYRRRFDPVMASRSPAHVTLVYPEEYDDEKLLRARIENAAADVESFPMVAGRVNHNPDTGGVWLSVEDPTRAWSRLREAVLAPPFGSLGPEPHVTVVHPRTSRHGQEAIQALGGDRPGGELRLTEVVYAETGSRGMRVIDRFRLTGGPAERAVDGVKVVVGILLEDGRLLLGHRHPDRAPFPDVWDLPGGHVDDGEAAAEALHRELVEELGISVEQATELTSLRLGDFELTFFLVDEWRGVPRNKAPDEHDELRWVGVEDLADLQFVHPVYLPLLRRAATG